MRFYRYQLKKAAVQAVRSGHPWIYRDSMSGAVEAIPQGAWLELVDAENRCVGFGLYEEKGLIAIRVVSRQPTAAFFAERLERALRQRQELRKYTNAFRALHGENDGVPGVVVDVYDTVAVLQTYARSVDPMGRYCAKVLREKLQLRGVV